MNIHGTHEIVISVPDKKRERAEKLAHEVALLWRRRGYDITVTTHGKKKIVITATVPVMFVLRDLTLRLKEVIAGLSKSATVTSTEVKPPVDIFR